MDRGPLVWARDLFDSARLCGSPYDEGVLWLNGIAVAPRMGRIKASIDG